MNAILNFQPTVSEYLRQQFGFKLLLAIFNRIPGQQKGALAPGGPAAASASEPVIIFHLYLLYMLTSNYAAIVI